MAQRIPLTRGCVALVDDADYDYLLQWKWHVSGDGYAAAFITAHDGTRRREYMHRLLLDARPGQLVDHIDSNPLNNTRGNLRLVDAAQNQWNRRPQHNDTGYKGVSWHSRAGRYYARIQVHGARLFLGYFESAEEAAAAYDAAAEHYYGEFARPNCVARNVPSDDLGTTASICSDIVPVCETGSWLSQYPRRR